MFFEVILKARFLKAVICFKKVGCICIWLYLFNYFATENKFHEN